MEVLIFVFTRKVLDPWVELSTRVRVNSDLISLILRLQFEPFLGTVVIVISWSSAIGIFLIKLVIHIEDQVLILLLFFLDLLQLDFLNLFFIQAPLLILFFIQMEILFNMSSNFVDEINLLLDLVNSLYEVILSLGSVVYIFFLFIILVTFQINELQKLQIFFLDLSLLSLVEFNIILHDLKSSLSELSILIVTLRSFRLLLSCSSNSCHFILSLSLLSAFLWFLF